MYTPYSVALPMTTYSLYSCKVPHNSRIWYYLVRDDGTPYSTASSIRNAFSVAILRRRRQCDSITLLASNFSTYDQLLHEYPELFI